MSGTLWQSKAVAEQRFRLAPDVWRLAAENNGNHALAAVGGGRNEATPSCFSVSGLGSGAVGESTKHLVGVIDGFGCSGRKAENGGVGPNRFTNKRVAQGGCSKFSKIACGGVLSGRSWQATRVGEVGVIHAQLTGFYVHGCGEIRNAAGVIACQRACDVVAAPNKNSVKELLAGVNLSGFDAHPGRLGPGVFCGNGDRLLQVAGLGNHDPEKKFLSAGNRDALICIFLEENPSVLVNEDGASGRDARGVRII